MTSEICGHVILQQIVTFDTSLNFRYFWQFTTFETLISLEM